MGLVGWRPACMLRHVWHRRRGPGGGLSTRCTSLQCGQGSRDCIGYDPHASMQRASFIKPHADGPHARCRCRCPARVRAAGSSAT